MHDIAHQGLAGNRTLGSVKQRRIIVVQRAGLAERCFHINDHPAVCATGAAIVPALAHAVQQAVSIQTVQQEAGQAANGTELAGTRVTCTGTSLVAVRVGDYANAITQLEGIMQ